MFTGIVEALGEIKEVAAVGSNKTFWLESPLAPHLKVDQSIAHNGVCLTVEAVKEATYQVTAVAETLGKTALHHWHPGQYVNLERSLRPDSRLDGHFVQGHIDTTGRCTALNDKGGSWEVTFHFPEQFAPFLIEKGSVCVNGVSLTCFNLTRDAFTVAIIPYTWQHTTFQFLNVGDPVNIEFDLIGKYILRQNALKSST